MKHLIIVILALASSQLQAVQGGNAVMADHLNNSNQAEITLELLYSHRTRYQQLVYASRLTRGYLANRHYQRQQTLMCKKSMRPLPGKRVKNTNCKEFSYDIKLTDTKLQPLYKLPQLSSSY